MDAGRLAVGQSGELCAPVTLPTGGLHTLSATVDEVRSVPEMNELNNSLEKRFASTLIDTQGAPELTIAPPAGPLPDLQITSVRVARNTDGSGTCQGDQSNYVLAQVKNLGQTPAKQFAVRLAVNGNLKQEKVLVAGLPLGATVDVKIQTDDLNDGPQQVKVLADGDNEVAESDENNNSRAGTADCD
jgi:subtilase family serine protease